MDNIKISVTMSEVKISKENLIKNYNEADKATKKMLEAIFGKDMFKPVNIMERVKSYEDACEVLGEHPWLNEIGLHINNERCELSYIECPKHVIAMLKLETIIRALNEGWVPPQDCETEVWYPWHFLYTQKELDEMSKDEKRERCMLNITGKYHGTSAGFGFAGSADAPSGAGAYFGSRLCLKTRDLAVYCGKQFIDLWAEFRLI